MKHKKYLLKTCKPLEGKTVIVTGASGTIGREICACCLILDADVIMAVRNVSKGEAVKQKLARHFPSEKISVANLDVSSTESIKSFVLNLPKKDGYCLINNAGALFGNKQYMTDFLGPIYLSTLLESSVERIVFQSSLSYAWKKSRTDWDDVQSTKVRSTMKKYGRAKRLLNLTAISLDNKKIAIVHPGVCSTNIIPTRLLQIMCRPFFHSARTAALPAVIALSKGVPQTHILGPRVFGVWGKPKLYKMQSSIFEAGEIERARKHAENAFKDFNA